jgi:uncharacterized protein (DUF885 family)
MTDTVRALADELQDALLAARPLLTWELGLPGADDRLDDLTREQEDALAARLAVLRDRLAALDPADLSGPDRITRDAALGMADREIDDAEIAQVEWSLGPMGHGPATLFAVASRSSPASPEQAEAYLARTHAYVAYLDQHLERLQAGSAAGRLPVARSRDVAVGMVENYLGDRTSDALADLTPPASWDAAEDWSARLQRVVDDEVRPALARWRDVVATLPVRPDDRCGMTYLPGGDEDYARLVELHTTLADPPEAVHALGRELVEQLQQRMVELGAQKGLIGFEAVRAAVRGSSDGVAPEQLRERSLAALSRAEAVVADAVPPPVPPPCRVEPMSTYLGAAGVPPHYTPPSQDGSREGTYWYNGQRPTLGAGWDLEAAVFHEAVPGHHLQVSRALAASDLPSVQSLTFVTAYVEGWALYAEELAEEQGLYSGVEGLLGALSARLARAARLVVDTGIHSRGWSRAEALEWFASSTTLLDGFVESEVDRYIAHPGQALGYMTGCLEILRLRDDARRRLGAAFTLPGFHGAVLDSGVLPLPALASAVEEWVAREGAAGGPRP